MYFIDAMTGSLLQKQNLFENQSALVQGLGVLGDIKKVSVRSLSGTFMADDQLRPPALQTYDMRGNLTAALNALNGFTTLTAANLAQDPTATWSDGANVDGHVYEGYTYDFFFKRFGRRGLDNRNTRIIGMTHTVRAQDVLSQPASVVGLFYLNAFYCPDCGRDGLGVAGDDDGTDLVDQPDLIYKGEPSKFGAVVDDIAEKYERGHRSGRTLVDRTRRAPSTRRSPT